MANVYEMFETNKDLEQKGIIVDYGQFRVRLAHAGGSNKKYKDLLDAKLKPYERQMNAQIMDDEVGTQILREVYAATIVLDFEVKNEDGTYTQGVPSKDGVTPFSTKEVIRLFVELPVLFIDLKKQAENFALYRTVLQEEAVKN